MIVLLVVIITCEYLIKIDINRHNNQLVECKQFAITIENLPNVNATYTILHLKAELWAYVLNELKKSDVAGLEGANDIGGDKEEAQIVDINFALRDYGHIESIKAMILAANRLESIKLEISELQDEEQ